jgi:hypothetical protein
VKSALHARLSSEVVPRSSAIVDILQLLQIGAISKVNLMLEYKSQMSFYDFDLLSRKALPLRAKLKITLQPVAKLS